MFDSIIRLSDAIPHRHQASFGVTVMEKLLVKFASDRTVKAAQRVTAYERKHPFSIMFLSPEQSELLELAKELVRDWG